MVIGFGCDHGGFSMKNSVMEKVISWGYGMRDYGAYSFDPDDDYPDLIYPLAMGVSLREVDRGIAFCGSGVGACVVANKLKGVRASLVSDCYSAHQGVEHDDMNLLCIGARVSGEAVVIEFVRSFLEARFFSGGSYMRRLEKLKRIEGEFEC